MTRSTLTRRLRRAAVVTAVAGAALVALPAAAHANLGWGGTLAQGQQACVQQYASYQVRGEGTATRSGAGFTVSRNGVTIYSTSPTTGGFAAEFRSSWGNFPGPGYYKVCARNSNSTNTLVNIRVLADAEI